MTRELGLRIALAYLAAMNALIGIWAQFFPQSFFDDFPGAGDAWVAVDGPYNEHLVRDVGALSLAMCVVLVVAAISLSKPLVVAAGVASLVAGVPHLIYHVRNTDGLDGMNLVASIGGLLVSVILPLVIIYVATRPDRIFSGR